MSTRETLRAIRGNVYGSQGQGQALDVPRAFVYRAAAHNVANGGGSVPIQWDTMVYDTDGMWNATGGVTITPRLACRTAGVYDVDGWILWPSDSTSYREIWITVNGGLTYTEINPPSAVTITGQSIHRKIALNAGDYIELRAGHNSVTNPLVLPATGTASTYDHGFQACLISTIN